MSTHTSPTTAAATDVSEFVADLDGGIFERKLSVALSQVAASTVDHDREGKVTVEFSFKKIPGTSQVHCAHLLKFTKPTLDGKASEEEKRTTALHVGKFGKLSIAPENQMTFLTKEGQPQ
jgi:hypothetical protein